MRLRSRGERPGRRQTSPKSTTSVYSARAGAISPNEARAAVGVSDTSDINVSFDGMTELRIRKRFLSPRLDSLRPLTCRILLIGDVLQPIDVLSVEAF